MIESKDSNHILNSNEIINEKVWIQNTEISVMFQSVTMKQSCFVQHALTILFTVIFSSNIINFDFNDISKFILFFPNNYRIKTRTINHRKTRLIQNVWKQIVRARKQTKLIWSEKYIISIPVGTQLPFNYLKPTSIVWIYAKFFVKTQGYFSIFDRFNRTTTSFGNFTEHIFWQIPSLLLYS